MGRKNGEVLMNNGVLRLVYGVFLASKEAGWCARADRKEQR